MREHGGGAVVNITSISAVARLDAALGLRHQQGGACASDKAARGGTRLARHPRQCASRPGRSRPRWRRRCTAPEIRADYHDAIPLNRYGLEEELAEAIFFLCSERASYITGQILAVDGGFDAAGIGFADDAAASERKWLTKPAVARRC